MNPQVLDLNALGGHLNICWAQGIIISILPKLLCKGILL